MRRLILALAGAAATATLFFWVSGALFMRMNGIPASLSRPWSVFGYLALLEGGTRPATRALLLACIALPWAIGAALAASLYLQSRDKPLHGAARFATGSEIRAAGLTGHPGGRILAGRLGRELLGLPGNQFALVAAPTRSGKGVGIVIPNCLTWQGSLVVLDIKQENYALTSGWRKHGLGQKVFLFAPFDPEGNTHRWNPLSYISGKEADRIGDVDQVAASLYSSTNERDKFWSESAKDLFRGLCLMVLENPDPEMPRTIGQILREASGYGKPLKKHIEERFKEAQDKKSPYSDACRDSLSRVLQNADNTLTSIVASFNVPLLAFQNPRVDAATSENTEGFDLRKLRSEPFTVYLGITPDRLAQARVIVNLFFDQLLALNTRVLPAADAKLAHQCLLVLDEFTAIGKVPMIEKAVSYMAGYGLRLLTIVQNRSQLEETYGRAGATTILANHAMLVLFAPSPTVTSDAREASEMLGYRTVTGRSRSRPSFWGKGGGSVSESDQRRALMLPQELRALGTDREIIALENTPPVLARKIRYYDDPFFRKRLLPPASETISKNPPEKRDTTKRADPSFGSGSLAELENAAPKRGETARRQTNWKQPRVEPAAAETVSNFFG